MKKSWISCWRLKQNKKDSKVTHVYFRYLNLYANVLVCSDDIIIFKPFGEKTNASNAGNSCKKHERFQIEIISRPHMRWHCLERYKFVEIYLRQISLYPKYGNLFFLTWSNYKETQKTPYCVKHISCLQRLIFLSITISSLIIIFSISFFFILYNVRLYSFYFLFVLYFVQCSHFWMSPTKLSYGIRIS